MPTSHTKPSKMIFVLPMWRTLKMLEAMGLTEDMHALVQKEHPDDPDMLTAIKPPPFKEVIENQPFF